MVQWVKDLASSLQRLLRCGFGPGPGDFHMPWVSQKNQKKKKTKKKPHTMVEEPAAECKRLLYCAQLCFRGLLHGTKHRTLNLR